MGKKALPGQTDYFEAFIKAAQYLAGLTRQQDMGKEIGKVLVHFFGADVGAFEETGPDRGGADGSHWTFVREVSNRSALKAETAPAVAEVLESGFLSERIISTPDLSLSVVCFPVTRENKVIAVMIAGHGTAGPFSKELLNVYMAVAGLVGTTVTRLALEREMGRHRRQLEQQVKERTTELTKVNDQLRREIIERNQAEGDLVRERNQLQHLLDLYRRASARIHDIEAFVIEECVRISASPLCFFGFVNPEETEMRTHLWSRQAMAGCAIDFRPIVFSLPNAGIWAEAIRTRKPLIINDYNQPDSRKRGYPEGHVELHRLLSIPIIKADRVVAVMAVANKESAYTQGDILHLSLFIESMWDLLKRKEAEEALRTLNDALERKVEEKTSQLIKAQNTLVRKEKLAVLGQLAGTVGHELRNPLGVMNNAIYFLSTVLTDADDIVQEYLGIIQQEINTSLQIITDLMDFARTKKPQISSVALETMIRQSIERCTIPKDIAVSMEIPEGLPLVHADLLQMVQVFQNLITNAVQAMPDGGRLSIFAQKSDGPPDPENLSSEPSGQQVIIIGVTDTGTGISPENMENLFQPLFTTKAKGIGLGLVACKNIVEAHGGKIAVESIVGQGTTFSIMMPMAGDMQ